MFVCGCQSRSYNHNLTLAKLHKFFIEEMGMAVTPKLSQYDCDSHLDAEDMALRLQDQLDDDWHIRRRDTEASVIRYLFTADIQRRGLRHPIAFDMSR
jgi:hypothetical protein